MGGLFELDQVPALGLLDRSCSATENRLHIYRRPCCTCLACGPRYQPLSRTPFAVRRRPPGRDKRFTEFTCCRSDLCEHLREHVYVKESSVQLS
jgi:hypothetical protein